MDKTKIDWADSTWNPVTGCRHGCKYCYARGIAQRFCKSGLPSVGNGELYELDAPVRIDGKIDPYPFGFEPTFHKYRLKNYKNRSGRNIFVCSMADLFGDWVPDEWIVNVIYACLLAPQHRYIFLTKNPARYKRLHDIALLPGGDLFWYGTTLTNTEDFFNRGPEFYASFCGSNFKTFLSIEPLQEDLDSRAVANLRHVNWVIVGAESGNHKDKVIPEKQWIDKIAEECALHKVPLFMKESLRELMGSDFKQQYPDCEL